MSLMSIGVLPTDQQFMKRHAAERLQTSRQSVFSLKLIVIIFLLLRFKYCLLRNSILIIYDFKIGAYKIPASRSKVNNHAQNKNVLFV